MSLLIFGKTGQVATELQRLAPEARALSRAEADLTDPEGCAAAIRASDATAVINAAAYAAVDKAESEEALATLVNGSAPTAMAVACAEKGLPFLHVSTDYVFDGSGETPWKTSDPVAPLNAYGRSKLVGEEGVRAAGGAHAILRTSWVVSSHGNNFIKTMLRLSEARDALSVVDDQVGGPTPAADVAATLLMMAVAMRAGQAGGTYHFGGVPVVSWKGFACEIFRQAGRRVAVSGIATSAYPTPARRPLNSRLDCSELKQDFGINPPDWKAGLVQILKELKVGI